VSAWRVTLESRRLGSVSINVRITAIRKLAVEAADNGLLAPELAAGIARIKGVRSQGVRVGNWLSLRQAQTAAEFPGHSHQKGTARPSHVCDAARMRIAQVRTHEFDDETRPAEGQQPVHRESGRIG
jgi:hypothetical protein